MKQMLTEIERLVERLWPMLKRELAGRHPAIQGAVLADICSIWLAGNCVPGDPAATDALREDLLAHQINTMRKLVPINARDIGAEPGNWPTE